MRKKKDRLEQAYSAILLSLGDEVLREIVDEVLREIVDEETTAGLWLKLESQYMTKSLTNRLYIKQ